MKTNKVTATSITQRSMPSVRPQSHVRELQKKLDVSRYRKNTQGDYVLSPAPRLRGLDLYDSSLDGERVQSVGRDRITGLVYASLSRKFEDHPDYECLWSRAPFVPPTKAGFGLVELMIVIVIAGVLLCLAIPAYATWKHHALVAEAPIQLKSMSLAVDSYYAAIRVPIGLGGSLMPLTNCTVASDALNPPKPSMKKQRYVPSASAQALGFSIADYVYWGYRIESDFGPGSCNVLKNKNAAVVLHAVGDAYSPSSPYDMEMVIIKDTNDVAELVNSTRNGYRGLITRQIVKP